MLVKLIQLMIRAIEVAAWRRGDDKCENGT